MNNKKTVVSWKKYPKYTITTFPQEVSEGGK